MGRGAIVMKFEALAKLKELGHSWPEQIERGQECPHYPSISSDPMRMVLGKLAAAGKGKA
jgi:hypothetical protein